MQQHRRLVDAAALAAVVLAAALAFAVHFDSSPRRASGDTYYYLSQSLEFAGVPAQQAQRVAGEVVCTEAHRLHLQDPRSSDCTRYKVHPPRCWRAPRSPCSARRCGCGAAAAGARSSWSRWFLPTPASPRTAPA